MGNEKIDKVFPAAAFPRISAEGGDLARKINADGDQIESTDDVTYLHTTPQYLQSNGKRNDLDPRG